MFTIKHIQDSKKNLDYLELKNSDNSTYAKIDLPFGGSLQELTLGGAGIISSENMAPYPTTFGSSILFPFANRIENGRYSFNHKNFQLDKNETDRQNALHGLVYSKAFQLKSQDSSQTYATVDLIYNESDPISGFPYKYAINLGYTLTQNALELKVVITNKDKDEFPFSLGWHPYFKTSDLNQSYLKMDSQKKLLVNERMIPNGSESIDLKEFFKIEDKAFDDCFILNSNMVEFKTPDYHLELLSSSEENYLQLYTPNDRKCIAIEPQTAPANCFNNQMGLQILQPNKSYQVSWKINLK